MEFIGVVRNNRIGPEFEEHRPLHRVDTARSRFAAGHADCGATGAFDFDRFRVAVAEADQIFAGDVQFPQPEFDDIALGEIRRRTLRAEDAIPENRGVAEQFGFRFQF